MNDHKNPFSERHFPENWRALLHRHDMAALDAALADLEQKLAILEAEGSQIFPAKADRYRALEMVAPEDAKVVLIGQDPYHGLVRVGETTRPEAMGMSFSVPRGAKIPPSLRNIFKERLADVGVEIPNHGDLTHWAEQGVLMLNAVLTVEMDRPKSHGRLGWQAVTRALIAALSASSSQAGRQLVFILWGNDAKTMKEVIAGDHVIIESSHPSPIGGSCNKGFFGSRPFSRANEALRRQGLAQISW